MIWIFPTQLFLTQKDLLLPFVGYGTKEVVASYFFPKSAVMKRQDSNRNKLDHLANVQSINTDLFTTGTE
ncbi:hypothetical protein [Alkalihalobacillus sp. 1P02AB]|uniref:hypothetical protein n=1 Tax=Alkalihalobacillus sp. 1P02AB TaxID=3132260 RepID=UPI0039A53076